MGIAYLILDGKPQGKKNMGPLGADGGIISNNILEKLGMRTELAQDRVY
jgi:hypothetical protein